MSALDAADLAIIAAIKASPVGLTTPQLASELALRGHQMSHPSLSRRLTRLAFETRNHQMRSLRNADDRTV